MAVAEEAEAHAAEGELMAAAERKLRPTGSALGPPLVQRVRQGMPVSAGTALSHLGPNGARQANHRARVIEMTEESTRKDRMRVLIAIAEPVECALTGASREES